MKKLVVVCLMLALTTGVYGAAEIIDVQFTSGASATYNAGERTLTWGNGNGLIYLVTTEGTFEMFDQAELVFNCNLADDITGSGDAAAEFDLNGGWQMTLSGDHDLGGGGSVNISFTFGGTMYQGLDNPFGGKYLEYATDGSTGPLDGSAWLQVDNSSYDFSTTWGQAFQVEFEWGSDNVIGMDSHVSLDSGESIDNYTSDSYQSTGGLAITLWDDESNVVPEPATMVILGLGSLVLLRRRKA